MSSIQSIQPLKTHPTARSATLWRRAITGAIIIAVVGFAGACFLATSSHAATVATPEQFFQTSGRFSSFSFFDNNRSGQANSNQQSASDSYGRFDLSMTARPRERWSATITASSLIQFGASNQDSRVGSDSPTAVHPVSRTHLSNLLSIREAYGALRFREDLKLYVGRQALGVAQDALIGSYDRSLNLLAFDGFKLEGGAGFGKLSASYIKLGELSTLGGVGNPASDPETSMILLSLKPKDPSRYIENLELFFSQVLKDETTNDLATDVVIKAGAQNYQQYGLAATGFFSVIKAAFVGVYQNGQIEKTATKDIKIFASMFDIKFSLISEITAPLRLSVSYHVDTGDDLSTTDRQETYQAGFYDYRLYGGKMDVFRWGNLRSFRFDAGWDVNELLLVSVSYIKYLKSRGDVAAKLGWRYDGPGLLSTNTNSSEVDLGQELAVSAEWRFENNTKIGAQVGLMKLGDAFRLGLPTADATVLQTSLSGQLQF
jgi:hypothetical protein